MLNCPLLMLTIKREAVNTNFYSIWFDSTGNQTPGPPFQWQTFYSLEH